MKKLLTPIIIFFGLCQGAVAQEKSANATTEITTVAQEKSNLEMRGDKYFFVYSFDKAIDSYNQVNIDELTIEGERKLADSYYKTDQNVLAEQMYSRIISTPHEVTPADYFNYAMVLKANGKYGQADIVMDIFTEQKPDDLRGKNFAANIGKYDDLLTDKGNYGITHLFGNTDDQDFGASFYNHQIVFASTRSNSLAEKKFNWNHKPFLDIYYADIEDNKLKSPKAFDKTLNGKLHDGPACFCNNCKSMAFTRNNYSTDKNDDVVNLQVFFSTKTDSSWTKPEPFYLNSKDYSIGHPFLTEDGNTMYFASDMPGGYGGADIYRVKKDSTGKWAKPENLGDSINTEGDEMFPYLEENNEILYYSSNGRFGLGGLDIFITPIIGTGFGKSYNAGFPLNTRNDDFAAIVDGTTNKGYFSSNRTGGNGDDDIYSFDILKARFKKIKGMAMDTSGNIVPNTFVTLSDNKGKMMDTITTKADGSYNFIVDSDKNFDLKGTHPNYLDADSSINSFGKDLIVFANLIMKDIPVKIEVGVDLAKALKLNPIYFDFNKWNIRPDAALELDKIVKIMTEYPDMVVELGAHTDCRGTRQYNQALSEKRAKSSAAYIKKRIKKPARIYGKGYGESKLVNNCQCEGNITSDCPEEEHQKNRRTEFIIIKK